MEALSFQGRFTLVTGASAGLGREMARELATRHGSHLVLVARRRERLEELARELEPHGTKVVCITADLSKAEDVERVFAEATAGRVIHAAILNAGVTYLGHHLELSHAQQAAIVATNVTSVMRLTHDFLNHQLQKSPGGGVMVVGSLAGVAPTTYQALYAGTKAFLGTWGVALAEELRGRDASLTVFVPGGIATEMGDLSGTSRVYGKTSIWIADAGGVARAGLKAFIKRKRYVIPGLLNRLNNVFLRLGSRSLQALVMRRIMGPAVLPPGQKQP